MHTWIQSIHNLARWVVVLAGAWSMLRGLTGLLARGSWLPPDQKAARLFPVLFDLQVVIGVVTWLVLSVPVPEHAWASTLALVFAHAGTIRARRAKIARQRFQSIVVLHGLALLLILVRMPWHAPLFRLP